MGLKCELGTPISFLLLLASLFYFTAKAPRLRELRSVFLCHEGMKTLRFRVVCLSRSLSLSRSRSSYVV